MYDYEAYREAKRCKEEIAALRQEMRKMFNEISAQMAALTKEVQAIKTELAPKKIHKPAPQAAKKAQ